MRKILTPSQALAVFALQALGSLLVTDFRLPYQTRRSLINAGLCKYSEDKKSILLETPIHAPREKVRIVLDADGYLISAGHPNHDTKELKKERVNALRNGGSFKTVSFAEYLEKLWYWEKPGHKKKMV